MLTTSGTQWNWFSSLLYVARLPLGQWEVTQKMDCTADLLLVFVWDESASGTARSNIGNGMECISFVLLLAVPEAVSLNTKPRSRSAVQSILSLAPRCPRGSLVPYKSEEHQFCGALLTERTVCGMLYHILLFVYCKLMPLHWSVGYSCTEQCCSVHCCAVHYTCVGRCSTVHWCTFLCCASSFTLGHTVPGYTLLLDVDSFWYIVQ